MLKQHLVCLDSRGNDRFGEFQQLQDPRVSDAVVHAGAGFAALDQALLAERREMLRGAAGIQLERRLQRAHRQLTCAQQLQNPNADGVPEDAKELGFQCIDWRLTLGHACVSAESSKLISFKVLSTLR